MKEQEQPAKKKPGRMFTREEASRGGKARQRQIQKQKEKLERQEARAGQMTLQEVIKDLQQNPDSFLPPAIGPPWLARPQQAEARKYPPGVFDIDRRTWRHRKREIETQVIEADENGESLDALPE